MKIEPTFLRSKVARRIFTLFMLCALMPISALAVMSFSQVTKQLERQSQRGLHQSCKTLGMSIFERLSFLGQQLESLSFGFKTNSGASPHWAPKLSTERLKEWFKGLVLVTNSGTCNPIFGDIQNPSGQSAEEKKHLKSGKTVVLTGSTKDNRMHIYMMRAVDPQDQRKGILFAEINSMDLWGLSEYNTLPNMTELCILDQSNNVIYSTLPLSSSFSERLTFKMDHSSLGQFEWKYEDKGYLTSFWSIPLKFEFLHLKWTVVMSASKADILAPMAQFKTIFLLIVVLSLLVVLFLSVHQIRKTTLPLEKLKNATQRVAMRDFDNSVTVTSGDEFEELAVSFNNMTKQLQRHFSTLNTMAEIDRAILSSLDTEKIVFTATTRIQQLFGYDLVSAILLDCRGQGLPQTYICTGKSGAVKLVDDIEILPEDLQKINYNEKMLLVNVEEHLPRFLVPFASKGIKSFVVFPLLVKKRLAGVFTLGSFDSSIPNQKDLFQEQRLADQMAVALSNAQLLEELNELNIGTLTALARAVDAKSAWTGGHSERVTETALKIGQVMGLTPNELDDLRRGGLLHDIGKIGIPAKILDKPGKLTDEEYRIIKDHPRMGVRIIEPIVAYHHITPMVLQHHERFDGKGYPDGLSGKEICSGARILAVADVYDAILSDRPYRKGMKLDRVIDIIEQEACKQFDPNVVHAFLEVITPEKGKLKGNGKKKLHLAQRHTAVNFSGQAGKTLLMR